MPDNKPPAAPHGRTPHGDNKPPAPPTAPPAAPPVSGSAPVGPNVPLPDAKPDDGKPDLCGVPVTYKTRTGEEKTGTCVKARGHDKDKPEAERKHSARAIPVRIDTSAVKVDMLVPDDLGDEIDDSELPEQLTERVREPNQLLTDQHVTDGYAKWAKLGKPTNIGAKEIIKRGGATRYSVAPENIDAVRTLLRRAGTFVKTPEGKPVRVRVLPPQKHVDGTMKIWFIVTDQSEARKQAGKTVDKPEGAKEEVKTG